MRLRLAVLLFLAVGMSATSARTKPNHRHHRTSVSEGKVPRLKALWNLEEMAECVLDYNALVYNDYGCWCGVGGSHEPVDEIDRCCMLHDKCYDAAVDKKICFDTAFEYVDDYSWACSTQANETARGAAVCRPSETGCAAAICECDRAVTSCWARFPRPATKAKCNHVQKVVRHNYFFDV